MTQTIVQLLVNMVEQTPDLTLKVMKERLATEAGVQVLTSSIARALDGQLISMKNLQDCPAQRNSIRTKTLRVAYTDWYLQQDAEKVLVFVECRKPFMFSQANICFRIFKYSPTF